MSAEVERVLAEVLCRADDSMYHHERTDDFPCWACRKTAAEQAKALAPLLEARDCGAVGCQAIGERDAEEARAERAEAEAARLRERIAVAIEETLPGSLTTRGNIVRAAARIARECGP